MSEQSLPHYVLNCGVFSAYLTAKAGSFCTILKDHYDGTVDILATGRQFGEDAHIKRVAKTKLSMQRFPLKPYTRETYSLNELLGSPRTDTGTMSGAKPRSGEASK